MKILFLVLALALLIMSTMAQEDKTAPGRDPNPKAIEHEGSDGVLEQLQEGNDDVFVIVFYVDQSEGDKALQAINEQIKEDHPWVRTTTVDLTKAKEYAKLFKVLKLDGEPKRGHSTPQALVMSKGEGFVIRGPTIAEGVKKRIETVEKGTLFGQGTAASTGRH